MISRVTILVMSIVLLMSCGNNNSAAETTQGEDDVVMKQENEVSNAAEGSTDEEEEEKPEMLDIDAETAAKHIASGFIPFRSIDTYFNKGDFDNDGLMNFTTVVTDEEETGAYLQIYEQQPDNSFAIVLQGKDLMPVFGAMGGLSVKKNIISITQQENRSDAEYKFRYDKVNDDYVLIGSELNFYGNAAHDGAGNISTNYLTGKRIKNINKYDYESEELVKQKPVESKVPSVKEKPTFLKDFEL